MIYKPRRLEKIEKSSFQEYEYQDDIFNPDSPYLQFLKKRVQQLKEPDRTILLCYAELRSLEKVAKLMNVSTTCIYWEIRRIRKELLKGLSPEEIEACRKKSLMK